MHNGISGVHGKIRYVTGRPYVMEVMQGWTQETVGGRQHSKDFHYNRGAAFLVIYTLL